MTAIRAAAPKPARVKVGPIHSPRRNQPKASCGSAADRLAATAPLLLFRRPIAAGLGLVL
jgi:hypothetical protein